MNIVEKRRSEIIKIWNQIRQEKVYIKNDVAAIKRLQKLNIGGEWSCEQTQGRIFKNQQREKEIEALTLRAENIRKGMLDHELPKDSIKKQVIIECTQKKIEPVQERRSERSAGSIQREKDKNWQFFVKSRNSIPDYMLKKLKTMPNNKGYIWKNIYCYGERPASPNEPVIMFENQRDGLLIIHETTDKEYKIWYKRGTSKKILHSCTQRRKLSSASSSLGNYIKK